MTRKYLKYPVEQFKKELPELLNSDVEIYIDMEDDDNSKKIVEVLRQAGSKKVKTIVAVILKNEYYDAIYKREDKNITAIKLKSGKSKNQNYRIYCKEIYKDGKKVVMITTHIKKVQKNQQDQKILNIIKNIKTYEYEF